MRRADRLAGALLDALDEAGHDGALAAARERYREAAGRAVDRDRLARALLAEVMNALDPSDPVAVFADGVRGLLDRFSAVLRAAPVAVVGLDETDRVRLWNPAAEGMFDLPEGEALGEPYPPGPVDAGRGGTPLDRLHGGEELAGVDFRPQRADGSRFDARLWAAPLTDDGEYAGAILIVADVTDRRRRRERLAVMNRVLRHNVRNDVNAIRGYVDLLAAEVPEGDERVAAVRRRLDDVLELSETARRVERLADGDERTRMDAAAVLRDRAERVRRTADCEVLVDLPDSAPVFAHELLPYAVDALLERLTDGAGAVVVSATPGRRDGEAYTTVELAVDRGLGAPDRRVLDGGEETPLDHGDGTGLWLARWTVDESGGHVGTDGDGTVVVELPAARAVNDAPGAP